MSENVGVTAPQGFTASGVVAGLKSSGDRDVAVVVNNGPEYSAAAVFTSNKVAAAPVQWSRQVITDGRADAVVLNSGGANACTGAQGFQNTHTTAEAAAAALGISPGDVLVCSTGLIGVHLPMNHLIPGVQDAILELSETGGGDAAEAIMTTDTIPKTNEYMSPDGYIIGGMAKGAGMLAPGLATMLVVITTDASLSPTELDRALREACRTSFNRADSDGCMSTNDTVIAMASGASGIEANPERFTEELRELCQDLAEQLIADAEGADHTIAITTLNAATEAQAEEASRAVARSNLFKTAIFGKDPNWGRVLSAVGTTGAEFDPNLIDVTINDVMVCRAGGIGEDRDLVDLGPRDVSVVIDLHAGEHLATILTNDLTHAYVHENSAYSS